MEEGATTVVVEGGLAAEGTAGTDFFRVGGPAGELGEGGTFDPTSPPAPPTPGETGGTLRLRRRVGSAAPAMAAVGRAGD